MTEQPQSRNPRVVAILAFLLGTVSGMCYLGRGKYALIYLALVVMLTVSAPFIFRDTGDMLIQMIFTLQGLGFIHCRQIALRKDTPPERRWYSRWPIVLLAMFPLCSLPLCLFRDYVYRPFHIPTASMNPTLNIGAYVWVKRSAYLFSHPQRGDIVAFRHPHYNTYYIKRIIGMPRDVIQIKSGITYINNVPVSQKPYDNMPPAASHDSSRFTEKLPEGKEYFILITDRNLAPENTSVYVVPDHDYFVMGDNRDHSRDSRIDDCGFIPEGNILGKATVTWWNGPLKDFNPTPVD